MGLHGRNLFRWFSISVILLLFTLSGCATSLCRSQMLGCPKYLYPATVTNYYFVDMFTKKDVDPHWIPLVTIVYFLSLVDLPFSLTSDSIFLPYDLYVMSKDKRN